MPASLPYLWMFVSANLFALMNLFARLATEHVSWALVGSTRSFVGALVAFLFARARHHTLATRDHGAMWRRSLLGTATMCATFFAISRRDLPLADTVTLLNVAPILTALLSPLLLGESNDRRTVLAVATGAVGVTLVVRPAFLFGGGSAESSRGASLTALVAILAAALSSLAMIALRRVGQKEGSEAIAFHFSLTAGVVLLALAIPTLSWPPVHALGFMALAGLCAGLGQLAMTTAYQGAAAARIAPVGYFSVVTSALLGSAVFDEKASALGLVGMALVVAGGVVTAGPTRGR